MTDLWWKKMIFVRKSKTQDYKPVYFWDSILVVVYAVIFIAILCQVPSVASSIGLSVSLWEALFFGFLLPWLTFNWIIGFLTYQHHTHPRVPWFSDYEEWDYLHAQIEATTHVKFSRAWNFLFHNIMEHTAHHAQTRIPLYRLSKAQRDLEKEFSSRVVVIHWTWRGYFDTLKRCKLYDYDGHFWMDFNGVRTSDCTLGEFAAVRKPQRNSSESILEYAGESGEIEVAGQPDPAPSAG